jgi:hypothetical protein
VALHGAVGGDEAVSWLHVANVVVLVVFWLGWNINPWQPGCLLLLLE